jgi:outer membrane protein assembly factor BamB
LTGVAPRALSDDLELLWTYEAADAIESSAAIVDGVVYVGSSTGDLAAVDLQTGKPRWTYKAGDSIGESSPAVRDGIVYVGDLHGAVHAVDAATGRRHWIFKTDGEVKSSPVVTQDLVLIGSYDGHLYALGARTGALKWKRKTDGPVHATAAVADGVAYIAGCDERFRAIRIADGTELFHIVSGAYTGASPAISGQAVFFGTFNNEVLRLNLARRRVAWRYHDPDRQFPFYSSAAVSVGRVVVGGRDKVVHCLAADTGKQIWSAVTRARVDSSPAIAGSRVYVGSNDGRLYGLDLTSGRVVWEFQAGAPLSASPAIAAGRLVIGAQDGRLHCFGSVG